MVSLTAAGNGGDSGGKRGDGYDESRLFIPSAYCDDAHFAGQRMEGRIGKRYFSQGDTSFFCLMAWHFKNRHSVWQLAYLWLRVRCRSNFGSRYCENRKFHAAVSSGLGRAAARFDLFFPPGSVTSYSGDDGSPRPELKPACRFFRFPDDQTASRASGMRIRGTAPRGCVFGLRPFAGRISRRDWRPPVSGPLVAGTLDGAGQQRRLARCMRGRKERRSILGRAQKGGSG